MGVCVCVRAEEGVAPACPLAICHAHAMRPYKSLPLPARPSITLPLRPPPCPCAAHQEAITDVLQRIGPIKTAIFTNSPRDEDEERRWTTHDQPQQQHIGGKAGAEMQQAQAQAHGLPPGHPPLAGAHSAGLGGCPFAAMSSAPASAQGGSGPLQQQQPMPWEAGCAAASGSGCSSTDREPLLALLPPSVQ